MDAEAFFSILLNPTPEHKHTLGGSAELVAASIKIFAELPMARPAIIDYYSNNIFEKAIADYVSNTTRALNSIEEDYNVLNSIQQGLTNLVFAHPAEFSSTVSIWSIQLLGKLSQKYDRLLDSSSNKRWLESDAVRALLSLAAIGFWRTNNTASVFMDNDDCVTALLETYVKYSPAADWIVARLASSYVLPLTTRVLYNGLCIYQKNSVNGNNIKPIVLILEQLIDSHFSNLTCAFRKLVQWSMIKSNSSKNTLRRYVVPYLLKLSSSERLLPLVYRTVLEVLTSADAHATILSNQRHHAWISVGLKYTVLIERMAEMALKIDQNAITVITDLLEKCDECSFALHVMLEIMKDVSEEYRQTSKPLIATLTQGGAYKSLCKFMIADNRECSGLKLSFLIHLLNYISHDKPILFPKIVHYLLYHITSTNKLRLLLQFVQVYYFTTPSLKRYSKLYDVLKMTFTTPRQSDFVYTFFWENLFNVILQEKKGTTVFLKQGNFIKATTQHLFSIVKFLEEVLDEKLQKINKHINGENEISSMDYYPIPELDSEEVDSGENSSNLFEMKSPGDSTNQNRNLSICDNIARIIEMLDINYFTMANGVNHITLNNEIYRKLVEVIVKYFFYSLLLKRSSRRRSSIIAMKLFSKCCSTNRFGRILSTQLLVDGAVFKYSLLFGATTPVYKHETQPVSLFNLNIKQGFTSQMSQRHLAVFRNEMHKTRNGQSLITETCYQRQRLLLEALSAAMSENILTGPCIDALTSLSLWLVESVSTDVMYNGLPWPEDEFTKITMERDLHIRRMFQTTPILWSLLRFVAIHRPALCYCSVLLRGLTSVLIYQWLAWSYKSTPDRIFQELHSTTKNVLEILSLGQLLPAPLDTIAEVVPKLNAFEISFILRDCVWFYMKENVPAPVLFQENQLGQYWRNPELTNVPLRFIESLRTVMQKHLPDLASNYNQIFIQCPAPVNPASETPADQKTNVTT